MIYNNVWIYYLLLFVLLTCLVNAPNHTKCVSLSNPKCEIQPALTNLHPNEYSQELCYYPFTVKLDKSFNTLNDLSNNYVIQITKKIRIYMFLIWLQEKMDQKF